MELKNSKTTHLGGNKFALDAFIGAVQMREAPDKPWQDIKPQLVRDTEGLHIEGAPYAIKITSDGDRRIYPDKTDLSKWIYLPIPAFVRDLPKRIVGNQIIASAEKFDVIFKFTNTSIKFMVLFREAPPADIFGIDTPRITFLAETAGLDFLKILKARTGVGIPRPSLLEFQTQQEERQPPLLDWSFKDGKLELGFDLMGLNYPILLKNTTIDVQVEANYDDCKERPDDSYFSTTTNPEVEPSTTPSVVTHAGTRFTVTIAASPTITTAYADLYIHGTNDDMHSDIYGHDVETSQDFNTDQTVFSRTRTTATVAWDKEELTNAAWTSANAADNCPELKTIIQELCDSFDHSAGRALTLLWIAGAETANKVEWTGHDVDDTLATKLHVEYETGAAAFTPKIIGPF